MATTILSTRNNLSSLNNGLDWHQDVARKFGQIRLTALLIPLYYAAELPAEAGHLALQKENDG